MTFQFYVILCQNAIKVAFERQLEIFFFLRNYETNECYITALFWYDDVSSIMVFRPVFLFTSHLFLLFNQITRSLIPIYI